MQRTWVILPCLSLLALLGAISTSAQAGEETCVELRPILSADLGGTITHCGARAPLTFGVRAGTGAPGPARSNTASGVGCGPEPAPEPPDEPEDEDEDAQNETPAGLNRTGMIVSANGERHEVCGPPAPSEEDLPDAPAVPAPPGIPELPDPLGQVEPPSLPGPPPMPSVTGCDRGRYGPVIKMAPSERSVCASASAAPPGKPPAPDVAPVYGPDCGGSEFGRSVIFMGLTLGACGKYSILVPGPHRGEPMDPRLDLSDCELHGGTATDPAVEAWGGGVAFCVSPVVDGSPQYPGLDEIDEIDVDLSPCSRQAIDPAVTYRGGGVWFCIEYDL